MKRMIVIGIVAGCCLVFNKAHATPITYIANGVAAYETTIIDPNGISQSVYQDTELWGYITFDNEVETHTTDVSYYNVKVVGFHLETSWEEWIGDTGLLHWESEREPYGGVSNRGAFLPSFFSWMHFYFCESNGDAYSTANVDDWMILPPEIKVWNYSVSFSLHKLDPPLPVPEPSTFLFFAAGVIGLFGRCGHSNNKAPGESDELSI